VVSTLLLPAVLFHQVPPPRPSLLVLLVVSSVLEQPPLQLQLGQVNASRRRHHLPHLLSKSFPSPLHLRTRRCSTNNNNNSKNNNSFKPEFPKTIGEATTQVLKAKSLFDRAVMMYQFSLLCLKLALLLLCLAALYKIYQWSQSMYLQKKEMIDEKIVVAVQKKDQVVDFVGAKREVVKEKLPELKTKVSETMATLPEKTEDLKAQFSEKVAPKLQLLKEKIAEKKNNSGDQK
jgi:hypothetical protein